MDSIAKLNPNPLLTTAELAARPDFELGQATVSPSSRIVRGPGGEADLEPRVMQVLVVLADMAGSVVTRDTLFDRCWGNSLVGDDSLNRAVAGVRKVADSVAASSFTVETVPRTGYKLVVVTGTGATDLKAGPANRMTARRAVLAGGAAVATIGAAGWFWLGRERTDPQVVNLIADGWRNLVDNWPDTEVRAVDTFGKAVALDPENAEAWGLLAFAQATAAMTQPGEQAGAMAQAGERAARTALALDPREPNALLAMVSLQRGMIGRAASENELRRILAIAPDNTLVIRNLAQLLHGAGRVRDSYALRERAIAIEPLSPDYRARQAMSLWALGRLTAADQVSDRTMQLWPSHRLVRLARLMIFAFTGRIRAATAMVEDEETHPQLRSGPGASVWRATLEALEKRTPLTIAAARKANLEGSKSTPANAAQAILGLSALGELDAAFEVANGLLLARGSVIVRPKSASKADYVFIPGWRNTFGLFMPPTKPMRLDPRFGPLADGLGLTEYWRKRGIGPDAFLFQR